MSDLGAVFNLMNVEDTEKHAEELMEFYLDTLSAATCDDETSGAAASGGTAIIDVDELKDLYIKHTVKMIIAIIPSAVAMENMANFGVKQKKIDDAVEKVIYLYGIVKKSGIFD